MFALTENGFGGVFLGKTDFCGISTHKMAQMKETHFPTCLFISKNSVQVFRQKTNSLLCIWYSHSFQCACPFLAMKE